MTYRSRDKDHAEAGLRRPTRSVRLPLVLTVACVMLACSAAKAPDKPESPRLSKTVIMVRHAEKSAYPEKDPELTAAGLRRAAALAEVLEGRGVDLVITSELRRSRETAADIATRSGLRPRVVPVNAPGGVDAHISEISRLVAQLDPGTTTLVVAHGAFNRVFLAQALNLPIAAFLDDHFDCVNGECLEMEWSSRQRSAQNAKRPIRQEFSTKNANKQTVKSSPHRALRDKASRVLR